MLREHDDDTSWQTRTTSLRQHDASSQCPPMKIHLTYIHVTLAVIDQCATYNTNTGNHNFVISLLG